MTFRGTFYIHPTNSTLDGGCSALSTAIAKAMTVSMFARACGSSIRHPRGGVLGGRAFAASAFRAGSFLGVVVSVLLRQPTDSRASARAADNTSALDYR
jgi:hypothetical protein